MTYLRLLAVFGLVLTAVMAAAVHRASWLLIAIALGLVARAVVWKSLGRSLRATFPIVAFAAVLATMQWFADGQVSLLPLKALAAFLLSTAACRSLPWSEMVRAIRPSSRLSRIVLFGLFARHFTGILASESRRVLQARALRLTRRYGPGWFRSLGCAMAALLGRSLIRAERFYAAQLLRGLGE